jgi:hypothetical protein
MGYTLNMWPKLMRCLEYEEVELPNNLAENTMRGGARFNHREHRRYLWAGLHVPDVQPILPPQWLLLGPDVKVGLVGRLQLTKLFTTMRQLRRRNR